MAYLKDLAQRGGDSSRYGTFAQRGTASNYSGTFFVSSDEAGGEKMYRSNGATWSQVGGPHASTHLAGGSDPLAIPSSGVFYVRVASTENVSVASAPASIDGVTLVSGEYVLLKNQTAAAENGVWRFNGSGSALTRHADLDAGAEFVNGHLVAVDEGTVNADTLWKLTTDGTITVGTTALAYTQTGVYGQLYETNRVAEFTTTSATFVAVTGLAIPLDVQVGDVVYFMLHGEYKHAAGGSVAVAIEEATDMAATQIETDTATAYVKFAAPAPDSSALGSSAGLFASLGTLRVLTAGTRTYRIMLKQGTTGTAYIRNAYFYAKAERPKVV